MFTVSGRATLLKSSYGQFKSCPQVCISIGIQMDPIFPSQFSLHVDFRSYWDWGVITKYHFMVNW